MNAKLRYYRPILLAIYKGNRKKQDILDKVMTMLNINDEQKAELTKSRIEGEEGKRNKVSSDYDNALYDLKRKGLIIYEKGENILTKNGEQYVLENFICSDLRSEKPVCVNFQSEVNKQNTAPNNVASEDSSLVNLIRKIQNAIQLYSYCFVNNEATVRAEIIDPILKELGWQVPYIEREVSCNEGRVDYALKPLDKYQLIIETKSIETLIDSSQCSYQLKNYMESNRFEGCVGILTNGYQWICKAPSHVIKTTIESEHFIDFLRLLDFGKFDVEKIRSFNLSDKGFFKYDEEFKIVYLHNRNLDICESNPTNTMGKFIERYCREILELQDNKLLETILVSRDYNDFRNPDEVRKHCVTIDGIPYYYTRDYSTVRKRCLIQRIIESLDGVDAQVESK